MIIAQQRGKSWTTKDSNERLLQTRDAPDHLRLRSLPLQQRREKDMEAGAGRLARATPPRLENRLEEPPAVTARALAIYDPELIAPLTTALRAWGGPAFDVTIVKEMDTF